MKLEKVTEPAAKAEKGADRRRYEDACAATHGMDIIGERWALPVMRELMMGPRRFGELRKSLPLLSANVLTQRLAGLEASGIVRRIKLPPPASVQVYGLTPWGQEAGPVFQALGRWAAKSPAHDPTKPFSPISLMLSLRTMFSSALAGDFAVRMVFAIGEETFFLTIEHGEMAIGRGAIDAADLTITADTHGVAAAVYGGVPLDALATEGMLTLAGDPALFARFAGLFPMPEKAM